ncbi:Hypothetical predicted protein, partial [Olea europaea subsp. europaea]
LLLHTAEIFLLNVVDLQSPRDIRIEQCIEVRAVPMDSGIIGLLSCGSGVLIVDVTQL